MKRAGPMARWAGTVATIAMLVAYPASAHWYAGVFVGGYGAAAYGGGMRWVYPIESASTNPGRPVIDGGAGRIPPGANDWTWWFRHDNGPGGLLFDVPLWFPLVLVALPTAFAWYRLWQIHSRKPGCCIKCGYDLAGTPSQICPDCGSGRGAVSIS